LQINKKTAAQVKNYSSKKYLLHPYALRSGNAFVAIGFSVATGYSRTIHGANIILVLLVQGLIITILILRTRSDEQENSHHNR